MGGPKRIILAIVWVLLAVAAVVLIWFATLKPEVREIIFQSMFGSGADIVQTNMFPV